MAWIRRFVVTESSMEPTLAPGQGLVALRWPRVRAGQIRCVEHPERPGFWLVKRVTGVGPDATMTLGSDNVDAPGVQDSRTFGPVPAAGSFRVIVPIPVRWM